MLKRKAVILYEVNDHVAEEGRDMSQLDQCIPGRACLHVCDYLGGCPTEDLQDLEYYSKEAEKKIYKSISKLEIKSKERTK